jgi:hypothetical protein
LLPSFIVVDFVCYFVPIFGLICTRRYSPLFFLEGVIMQLQQLPLWLPLVLLRALHACLLQTHFNPDEYWQSLEVAHVMVFGYVGFFLC